MEKTFALSCPLPITERKNIVMGHGSGGKLTAQLVQELFLPAFDNEYLNKLDDQAVFRAGEARLAFTTDSFVVTPLFFPGGNIGELAVNGTVNDLAMSGAQPLFLSSAFIVEEGFPVDDLSRIVDAMGQAARKAGVAIVTGDTKVVNKGSADKLFITTSGVGLVPEGIEISASRATPGDAILLSGSVGDHGMAVMSVREGLEFEGEIRSDTAPLHTLVRAMLEAGEVHVLRDPTRGGLATSLYEIATTSSTGIEINSSAIPVREDVKGACEILGLDPLFVANEGKLVAFVPTASADAVLTAMRNHPAGQNAALVGRCVADHKGMVLLRTEVGGTRILDLP
ncbi:MAG: hydrogenase expression/formation protein HypE, partial [Bryobacterales bacterium]|nr:hydrogenase expression/formation protein HypE [Bryobacterales bacterium]